VQQGKTGDYILKNYVSAEVSENADRTTSGDDKNDFMMEVASHSLDAQFAQVLSTGQAISGNALSGALHRFLCVPVYYNGDIVATIGWRTAAMITISKR
jgi:hypothetical protein